MITTIFFDFAGVIATTKLFPRLAEIMSRKTPVSKINIEKALYTDAKRFVLGEQSAESFWIEFLKPLGIPLELFEEEMKTWYELRNDLLDYIDQLKNKGYIIHLLSDNFDVCTKAMRADSKLTNHFQKLYFSNELHLSKSSTELFSFTLKDAGVTAEESIFIDDKQKNINMAEQIGLKGFLFTDTKTLIKDLSEFGITV